MNVTSTLAVLRSRWIISFPCNTVMPVAISNARLIFSCHVNGESLFRVARFVAAEQRGSVHPCQSVLLAAQIEQKEQNERMEVVVV